MISLSLIVSKGKGKRKFVPSATSSPKQDHIGKPAERKALSGTTSANVMPLRKRSTVTFVVAPSIETIVPSSSSPFSQERPERFEASSNITATAHHHAMSSAHGATAAFSAGNADRAGTKRAKAEPGEAAQRSSSSDDEADGFISRCGGKEQFIEMMRTLYAPSTA